MKNLFEKIKNIYNSLSEFFKINPHKHWVFLLYTFFILITIFIVASIYFIYLIREDKLFQVKIDQTEKKTILKEELLKKTTSFYEQRAENEMNVKNKASSYKDPSL